MQERLVKATGLKKAPARYTPFATVTKAIPFTWSQSPRHLRTVHVAWPQLSPGFAHALLSLGSVDVLNQCSLVLECVTLAQVVKLVVKVLIDLECMVTGFWMMRPSATSLRMV